ncbi:sigma 54-interacting transcriptional regulator [Alteribacillus iranensis]|uniref:Transcriptional regulator containing PAS, AAA-type ATPase, and DNA-binding Fis domains n=1 Tax=Alteribacillus iranensis TaxID=930128 RepID=A0A1I2E2H7_9BACI|nr:sigma 54-interacting transcriptional regulator [Alteribacillus iranensis]SFE86876.1 Transcriptional regulator containing PAS, AAA-type ATPase, and DNA-binding Fis domains [Alteribacillus iranensis]
MSTLIKDKLHPLFTISISPEEENWRERLKEEPSPFLFIEKNNKIQSYIYLRDTNWEHIDDITIEDLLNHSHSLQNVGVINKTQTVIPPSFIFRILGEPLALVKDDEGAYCGYIRREDLLVELLRLEDDNTNLLKVMLSSIPMGLFITDNEGIIVNSNEAGMRMIKSSLQNVEGSPAAEWFNGDHIEKVLATHKKILNQIQIEGEAGVLVDYIPIMDSKDNLDGIMIVVQDLPKVEEMAMEIEYVKNLNADLNAILSSMYDEIIVVNDKGEILRYNDNFIAGVKNDNVKNLVGHNLFELEDHGFFNPSIMRLVLERREKVSIVQETEHGKNILAVGNPVFDENDNIHRIVIALRDITETTKLKSELNETRKLTKRYKEELESLRNLEHSSKEIVYCSPAMEQVMAKVKKLAEFHSTVLILGESGVGKELIAQSIHKHGLRADKPFLSINCGAIPENLLESELFGYTKGAFTGADTQGKKGYFQQADGGVLVLDEIGEISQQLQIKLLRVLQEGEVLPVGSSVPAPVDVQIIASTNKDLEKMVREGTFREDLYYRINVIPIVVPPLRDRSEDIPLLAYHFLQQLNVKYGKEYYFSPDALNLLEVYSWPGNIRELQNIIERLVVTAEDQVISAEFVRPLLKLGDSGKHKPIITDIIPFQEAQESTEEQLILLAMEKYKTTTKAAQALKISQSAVSRKYNKILKKQNQLHVNES